MSEQVSVVKGDRIMVTRLVGGEVTEPREYQVHTDGPDSEGDIIVSTGPNESDYRWAREWTKVEPEEAKPEDIEWNPITRRGDTVWVTEYYGHASVRDGSPYDVRTSTGTIDGDGDLILEMLAGYPAGYARRWRLPDGVEAPAEPDWNPRVKAEDEVLVYEYYGAGVNVADLEKGYDVRTSAGYIDSDGDLTLQHQAGHAGSYARRWRRAGNPEVAEPEVVDGQPEVEVGDIVKVLACLPGAQDSYRERFIGAEAMVTGIGAVPNTENLKGIIVKLRHHEGMTGVIEGAIHKWELVAKRDVDETAKPHVHGDDPTDSPEWAAIIANWREKLNEYACDHEWCEEYESTAKRLFGWESTGRQGEVEVRVRLSKHAHLSDCVRVESIFGGDEDDYELVDEYQEFEVDLTVRVMVVVGESPDRDAVEEELNNLDLTWDSFSITNWQTPEN